MSGRVLCRITDETWESEQERGVDSGCAFSELGRVLALVRSDALTVPIVDAERIADAWRRLRHLERALPRVRCWAVVKHYAHDPETWKPAIWCGFYTKRQAQRFAPKLEEFYARGEKRPRYRDRFKVEFVSVGVSEIMRRDLTPEQYINGIAR